MFQKATRRKAKLKLTITGPSGAGKTLSALLLAKGIGGKIAVIDTENDSASLYADQELTLDGKKVKLPEFDSMNLTPPYTTARYLEAIAEAVRAGYEIVVVDSGTHQWAGDGGILSRKEKLDQKPGSNSYTNWGQLTPEQEKFKAAILQAPIHLIMTLRSKQDYVLEKNEKGKSMPVKVGLAPIQRDGMEYEFTTVFDADMSHNVTVSKDRTGLFDGKYFPITEETGKELATWLSTGAEAKPLAPPSVNGATQSQGNSPRIVTGSASVNEMADPNRRITQHEFNGLKVTAGQHMWNSDQFFTFMRKKFGTIIGTDLSLPAMLEFKQALVSMTGAQAMAAATATNSGPVQLRGEPIPSPTSHAPPSPITEPTVPPQEFAPPSDENFSFSEAPGGEPEMRGAFDSFTGGLAVGGRE